jgi:methyl-accepting chemotaxis protein
MAQSTEVREAFPHVWHRFRVVQIGKTVDELNQLFDDRSKEIVKATNASDHFIEAVAHIAEYLQASTKRGARESSQAIEVAREDVLAMEEMTRISRAAADLTKELKEKWSKWRA